MRENNRKRGCWQCKKIVSLLLSCLVLFSALPLHANAETQGIAQVNLTDYITSLLVEKVSPDGGWEPVEGAIYSDSSIRVNMAFTIEGGKINKDQRIAVYEMPAQVAIGDSNLTGEIRNNIGGQNTVIGTYTITPQGIITIEFNEEFAGQQESAAVQGRLSFEATTSMQQVETEETISFPIKDGQSTTITVKPARDISVRKEATKEIQNNKFTGMIDYQLIVSSEKGTEETIKVADNLYGKADYVKDSFVIYDKNGVIVEGIEPPVFRDDGYGNKYFTYDALPPLGKDEFYTIRYKAKVTVEDIEKVTEDIEISNNVKVESGRDKDEAGGWVKFSSQPLVNKQGSYRDGKITWRILINPSKLDIDGLTISDTIESLRPVTQAKLSLWENYDKFIKDIPIIDNKLVFTFDKNSVPDTNATYSIVFETEIDPEQIEPGQNTYTNTVEFTEKGGDPKTDTGTVGVTGDFQDKVHKEITNATQAGATYHWQTTLRIPKAGLQKEYTSYTDKAGKYLYFTKETLQLSVEAVKKDGTDQLLVNGEDYAITFYENADNIQESTAITDLESLRAKAYRIMLLKDISAEEYAAIRIKYGSYADYSEIENGASVDLINTAIFEVNGILETDEAKVPYKKNIQLKKQVSKKPRQPYDRTSFTNGVVGKLDYDEINQTLHYRLLLELDKENEIVLVDTLPQGATFIEKSFEYYFYENDWYEHQYGLPEIQHQYNAQDNQLVITVPKYASENPKVLAIYYDLSIKNDVPLGGEKDYKNRVTQGDFGAETKVTVERPATVLAKKGEQKTKGDEYETTVIYQVVINPLAEDLDVTADTLTLTDRLNADLNDLRYLGLEDNSVAFYHYDAEKDDGKGERIHDAVNYQYQYNEKNYEISLTIPDEKALVMEYRYRYALSAEGKKKNSIVLKNEIMLLGKRIEKSTSETKVVQNSSDAEAWRKQVNIFKVDEADYSLKLPGAKFRIQQLQNKDKAEWETLALPELITDANGYLRLQAKQDNPSAGQNAIQLSRDILYCVTEVDAPSGYQKTDKPFYFIWTDKENDSIHSLRQYASWVQNRMPEIKPEDITFFGFVGGNIYVPNKAKTSVEVIKKWQDLQGEAIEPCVSDIAVQLYAATRQENEERPNINQAKPVGEPVHLNNQNDWHYEWAELPAKDENGALYYYFVKEITELKNCVPQYQNNEGIIHGVITITNIHQQNGAVLPDTGGIGTFPFFMTGIAVMIGSCYLYFKLKRNSMLEEQE